jgi:hypothetical protein
VSEQADLFGSPPEITGQPRVWTFDELGLLSRAVWPNISPGRARCHLVMMVLEGYPPASLTEAEREGILAAHANTEHGGGPNA